MRKISLFMVLCLLALPLGAGAEVLMGDVNGDGKINITDVTLLITSALNDDVTGSNLETADMNGDGMINITDVTSVITVAMNWSEQPQDEGDWVDLGLPSGTIWATRNVGASSPEDYGDYFAWGETTPKEVYNWDTYKWYQEYQDADGNWHSGYTKYCTKSDYGLDGFVDNKTELDPSDDAACAHYPGGRMPSNEQIQELCDNCTWKWTQRNGVYGQLVTGPNGSTMFLPAAGDRSSDSLIGAGSCGRYWSRTLYSLSPNYAYYLGFTSGFWYGWYDTLRDFGSTVRAVRVS